MMRPIRSDLEEVVTKIVVLGVGDCGVNTVTNLFERNVEAKLIAVNTDVNSLNVAKAHQLIQIGENTTRGRGAGGDISKGRRAAEEDIDKVLEAIGKPDFLIVTCGFGGGTGSGATPYILAQLRDEFPDLLMGAVVSIPFRYEGIERLKNTQMGLRDTLDVADFVIVNLNDILLERYGTLPLQESFKMMDTILANTIESIVDMLQPRGAQLRVDFADLVTLLRRAGVSFVGHGRHRSIRKAVEKAIESKLLDAELSSAKGALVYVSAPPGVSLRQAAEAPRIVSDKYGVERVIWGLKVNPKLRESHVMIIASGVKSRIVSDIIGISEAVG